MNLLLSKMSKVLDIYIFFWIFHNKFFSNNVENENAAKTLLRNCFYLSEFNFCFGKRVKHLFVKGT